MWKLVSVSALMVAVAAAAQPPGDDIAGRERARTDPERVVCIDQGAPGSRLTQRRVCRTRAEWEERKSSEQAEVYKWQTFGKPRFCGSTAPC